MYECVFQHHSLSLSLYIYIYIYTYIYIYYSTSFTFFLSLSLYIYMLFNIIHTHTLSLFFSLSLSLSLFAYSLFTVFFSIGWGSSCSIMTQMLDYSLDVSKFKLQLRYCLRFQTNTLRKGISLLISSAMG